MKKRYLAWLLAIIMAVSLFPVSAMAEGTGEDLDGEAEEVVVNYQLLAETDEFTVYTKEEYAWTLDEEGVYISGGAGVKKAISSLKIVFKEAGVFSFDWTVSSTERYGMLAYRISEEDYTDTSQATSQSEHVYTGETHGQENELIVAANDTLYLAYCRANAKDPNSATVDDAAMVTNLSLAPLVEGDDTVVEDPVVYDATMGTVTAQLQQTKINEYDGSSYLEMSPAFAVDGDQEGTDSVEADKTYRLKATPKEGYQFYGWVQNFTYNGVQRSSFRAMKYYTIGKKQYTETGKYYNEKVDITTPELEVTFDGVSTYTAVFAPKGEYVLRVNSTFYDSTANVAEIINNASSGDVVEILNDFTLTEDVTVKKGVVLYVPFRAGWGEDESLGKYRNYGRYKGINSTDHYVTLTVNDDVTLTVKGTLAVGAVIGHAGQGYQGNVSGFHGHILNNGNIVITEKGTMTCYGLVTGSGTVLAQNYGIIKESLLILDFAGGSNTLALYSGDQMPFERYNMQNIQCTLQLERYGTLTGMATLYAMSTFNEVDIDILGVTANSIFKPNDTGTADGSIVLTRTYDGSKTINASTTAGVGKTTWNLNGGLTFQTLTIDLGITTVRTDVADFPINCHTDFTMDNGHYEIPGKIKIMPGANVTVGSGATLKIGGKLIVLDRLMQGDMSGYRYPTYEELLAAYGFGSGNLYVNGTLQILEGATLGGLIQSNSDTGILVIAEGAYLTNSGDLDALDPLWDLNAQEGYQGHDWVQQIGGTGSYDDNTVWLNLPARIYDGESIIPLEPGTYSSAQNTAELEDVSYERYCSNGVTVNGAVGYTGGNRVMTSYSEPFTRTVKGTWADKTSAVEITSNTVAGSATTGVTVDCITVRNDDGTTTLTLTPKNSDNSDVTVKYVHLVKYVVADGTKTAEKTDGAYIIPADAKSVTIESAMLGDPTGDGEIGAKDATAILRSIVGKYTLSDLGALATDVTGDGEIGAKDATAILRYIVGKYSW